MKKYDLGELYGEAIDICDNCGILDDLGEGCWADIHISEKKMMELNDQLINLKIRKEKNYYFLNIIETKNEL